MHVIELLITNLPDRLLLTDFLQQSGYSVQSAPPTNNPVENRNEVSAFIIDENRAFQYGKELLALKANSNGIFLPLLITLPRKANYEKWLRAGFDDVLRFPLSKAELIARLKVFIRLREQSQETYKALQLKDEFLATISHELRTPLTAMLGWIQLIERENFDQTKIAYGLEVIKRNAKMQAKLIEDILDISRIVMGQINLERQPVDLMPIIQSALDTVRPNADAKNIQLLLLIEPDVGTVLGDSTRLQQVVWNLLSNAVKFTPKGGSVELRLAQSNKHAQISVSDNGEGISAEFLPYVFDRFRQADGTITRRNSGLGLGLAIAHEFVALHDGTIDVCSLGKGQGATFTVTLPLRCPTMVILRAEI